MDKRICLCVFMALFLQLVYGCSFQNGPVVRMSAFTTQEQVCKVAVLPFTNETLQPTAAIKVFRIFSGELIASRNFQVEPEGEVYFFLNRNRLRPVDLLKSDLYAELARQLDVDVVIRGRVITLEDRSSANGRLPYCAIQIDILTAESGALLFSTYHRRSGEEYQTLLHYGTIHTTSGLIAEVSREIINAWEKKGLSHCSD